MALAHRVCVTTKATLNWPMPVLRLANHVELHNERIAFMLVPKAASNAVVRACQSTSQHVTTNLINVNRNYYKIGIVRNTWDRLLSVWHSKCNPEWPTRVVHLNDSMFKSGMDFLPFLKVVVLDIEANHHFYPQHKIVGDCDEIWTTDELDQKWNKRFSYMMITHDNVNVHRDRDYRGYYTPDLVDMVAEAYEAEIKHFGFKF